MNKNPLIRAIRQLGTQRELAEALRAIIPGSRLQQAHISNWLRRNKVLPPQYAVPIEKATKGAVKRHEWAPDCYAE